MSCAQNISFYFSQFQIQFGVGIMFWHFQITCCMIVMIIIMMNMMMLMMMVMVIVMVTKIVYIFKAVLSHGRPSLPLERQEGGGVVERTASLRTASLHTRTASLHTGRTASLYSDRSPR